MTVINAYVIIEIERLNERMREMNWERERKGDKKERKRDEKRRVRQRNEAIDSQKGGGNM